MKKTTDADGVMYVLAALLGLLCVILALGDRPADLVIAVGLVAIVTALLAR